MKNRRLIKFLKENFPIIVTSIILFLTINFYMIGLFSHVSKNSLPDMLIDFNNVEYYIAIGGMEFLVNSFFILPFLGLFYYLYTLSLKVKKKFFIIFSTIFFIIISELIILAVPLSFSHLVKPILIESKITKIIYKEKEVINPNLLLIEESKEFFICKRNNNEKEFILLKKKDIKSLEFKNILRKNNI